MLRELSHFQDLFLLLVSRLFDLFVANPFAVRTGIGVNPKYALSWFTPNIDGLHPQLILFCSEPTPFTQPTQESLQKDSTGRSSMLRC